MDITLFISALQHKCLRSVKTPGPTVSLFTDVMYDNEGLGVDHNVNSAKNQPQFWLASFQINLKCFRKVATKFREFSTD